jgi:hypothetical protein
VAIRTRFSRHWWRTTFRFSERHTLSGCDVGIFLPLTHERATLEQKCADAFALLREYGPRELARIHALADGVLILGEDGQVQGEWIPSARLIRLNAKCILQPDTTPTEIAATIVHEATHAWLEHHGFRYTLERRQRIEAICFRAEAAFARRIPDGNDLAELYDRCAKMVLEEPSDRWSDQAFRERKLNQLRDVGAPAWLVNAVARVTAGLHAKR